MLNHKNFTRLAVTPANLLRLAAAATTAILYSAALPPFNQQECGWFALVPLLLLVRQSTPRQAALWSGLAGLFYWVHALNWLWQLIGNGGPLPLVILGQIGLALWCALFFSLFGWLAALLWQKLRPAGAAGRLVAVWLGEPLLWAGAELLRGHLFTGFPWDSLATALATSPSFIQIASVGGLPAVSAMLVLGAGAIASIIERIAEPLIRAASKAQRYSRTRYSILQSLETFIPLLAIIALWIWGVNRLRSNPPYSQPADWRIVLIQPDSPSIFAITEADVIAQRQVLSDQTLLAAVIEPDLTVWPETAVNGSLPFDPAVAHLIKNATQTSGSPLLTGAVEINPPPHAKGSQEIRHHNSAWLFSTNGLFMGRYRKQHLVPFGEYIPGDKLIPALQRLAPTGISCTPGSESSILTINRRNGTAGTLSFSPLICFEDLFSDLSRRAVNRGAAALVNLSNDAWFDGSTEPERHMRQAMFRAVENGVPLLRCGNTGITCAVDPLGRITRLDMGAEGQRGLVGFLPTRVPANRMPPTPYTRMGDRPLIIIATLLATIALIPRPLSRHP
jgi:apolipoprotein N-acyltransferase